MSKLFGVNKPNTNLRKNVFDLSERNLYTLSAGMLVPVFTREVNPGEKVQLSLASMIKTLPLNTAAYVRCRQYYHAFFVPYKQLWSSWDNFITGLDYKQSALQPAGGITQVPRLDLLKAIAQTIQSGDLSKYAQAQESQFARYDYTNRKPATNGEQLRPIVAQPADVNPSTGRATTKAMIQIKDELGYEYIYGISRLLDMLGYGVHVPMSNGVYSTLSEMISTQGLDAGGGTTRIDAFLTAMKDDRNRFSVNPFRLLAYQKIYNDFYKRDDYEATNPKAFNIDDFDGSKALDYSTLGAARLYDMLRIRYRWSPKDYFTGVVPSELFGIGGALNIRGSRRLADDGVNFGAYKSGPQDDIFVPLDDDGQQGITLKSIQFALAMQKEQRLTRRAGGHDYISQISAHYGFEPPKGRGDKVDFLGGWSSNINIGEVLATASTPTAVTGQSFGRGIGTLDGQDIEFTAREHGVVMIITSIVPDTDYSAEGLNAFNAKFQRGDYFLPEYQDMGLQPVYNYEFRNQWLKMFGTTAVVAHGKDPNTGVIGMSPRYSEYKTSYDTLHGEFRVGRQFSAWSADGALQVSDGGVVKSSLKINPSVLNRITAVAFDGSEKTDQFMCSAQLMCKVIRPMSVTGQNL